MKQIYRMLDKLELQFGDKIKNSVLHSHQGYQYQLIHYQETLKDMGIIQSMSRKGNCLDNSPTENLFGRMKTEMFYDKQFQFMSITDLKKAISNYVEYYNNTRIVNKLRMSPTQFRKQLSSIT